MKQEFQYRKKYENPNPEKLLEHISPRRLTDCEVDTVPEMRYYIDIPFITVVCGGQDKKRLPKVVQVELKFL